MKIVLVHNTYQQPGGEDVVFEQEKTLLERAGHHVATYRRSNHEISEFSAIGRAMVIPNTIWSSDSHRAFAQQLRCENPDVVHIHNTFMMISPSIYSACRDQVFRWCKRCTIFVCYAQPQHFFAMARSARIVLMMAFGRVSAMAAIVIGFCHRGSRTDARRAPQAGYLERAGGSFYRAFGFFAGQVRGLWISRRKNRRETELRRSRSRSERLRRRICAFYWPSFREKGLPTLVQAWTRLQNRMPLEIIGDGPERPALEQQVGVGGSCPITFRGRCSHEDTLRDVKRAKFVVLPSECYENFPMSIVEAFACGTPVICSRLGGMAELVDDHRTGLLFTPGDADDLAEKVEWAATHPADLAEMGREARREFELKYTAEKNYSYLMEIYENTVHACA